ncbi:MAG: hypothetical protein KGI97_08430, partial [Alphaproteobacteria bacterium]|nr:hypothetical protein [Alphaproteobacteria bacterium]
MADDNRKEAVRATGFFERKILMFIKAMPFAVVDLAAAAAYKMGYVIHRNARHHLRRFRPA